MSAWRETIQPLDALEEEYSDIYAPPRREAMILAAKLGSQLEFNWYGHRMCKHRQSVTREWF